jgi:hypothetical protein
MEMKVTSEHYKRSLIDCGDLDEGQSSGIYKIFPEDSLDGFYVYKIKVLLRNKIFPNVMYDCADG